MASSPGSAAYPRVWGCRKLFQHVLGGLSKSDERLVLQEVAFVGLEDCEGERLFALPVLEGETANIRVRNFNFCGYFWDDMVSIGCANQRKVHGYVQSHHTDHQSQHKATDLIHPLELQFGLSCFNRYYQFDEVDVQINGGSVIVTFRSCDIP